MNKKTKLFFISSFLFICLFITTIVYIDTTKRVDQDILDKKDLFISLVLLPDLAISTEAPYIRHRSLVTAWDIFTDGPEHIEYFASTFTTNYKEKK